MKTSEYKYCKFNFENFNPVQEMCYPFFELDCNLVLSATTSAGKTAIAEAIFGYELATKQDQKVIYVCPLKSIAEEKKFDWARDVRIEVPLNEFMKMKKKISKLQNKCKELERKADEQRSQRWKIESAYDKLKADYQKVLGITEEGDDGK